jgi:hypothetical protein
MHALAPGGFAYVPRGTVHTFANAGETTGRLLVGFTPGGIEGFFREAGRPATDDGPAPPVDDDEIARTIAAASTYGMQLVAGGEGDRGAVGEAEVEIAIASPSRPARRVAGPRP